VQHRDAVTLNHKLMINFADKGCMLE
jgi:hypothetical protein